MLHSLVSLLIGRELDDLIASAISRAGATATPIVRKLVIGGSLIFAGVFLLALGCVGLLGSLFITLAGLPFVPAALATTAVFFFLSVTILWIGLRVIQK
jgi:hypothetical protein